MECWEYELSKLVNKRKKYISYNNPNPMNKSLGSQLGYEDGYEGFRSVIFYFQLSTVLDLELMEKMIKKVVVISNSGCPQNIKFSALFFSDIDYKLIYPQGVISNGSYIIKIIKEYYDKHASVNEGYSSYLKYLFPPIDLYSREHYPSDQDLCIVFHDSRKITVDEEILQRLNTLKERFIWIEPVKDMEVKFSEDISEICCSI